MAVIPDFLATPPQSPCLDRALAMEVIDLGQLHWARVGAGGGGEGRRKG